jgi:hypothetical protein
MDNVQKHNIYINVPSSQILDAIYFLNNFIFVRKHSFTYNYRYFWQEHGLNSTCQHSPSLDTRPCSEIIGEDQKDRPRTQVNPH